MRRFLFSVLASVLLSCGMASGVQAQPARGNAGTGGDEKDDHVPGLQYAVAALSAILVLVIICMPSRKRTD
jgi:hypothetical protein